MISREVVTHTVHLLTERSRPLRDGRAVSRALLTNRRLAPDRLRVRLNDVALLLDFPDTPMQAVILKLAAVRALVDGDELIFGVPFVRPCAVGCKTAIRVVGEGLRRGG